MSTRRERILFPILAAALVLGYPLSSRSAQDAARMIEPIMGSGKTVNAAGRAWSSDLGIMVFHGGRVFVLTGDTMGLGVFSPNSLAWTTDTDASNGLSLHWSTYLDGNPKPFFPRIDPDSTVPAGACSVNGVLYVFMMDVTHWADIPDPDTRARPVLIKSTDNGASFSSVWLGTETSKFINTAPILGPHPTVASRQVVYLFGSGRYRNSSVYLAYAELEDIEFPNRYQFFKGLQNGVPQWTSLESQAVPVVSGVKVGELSIAWNNYLHQYLLAFCDGLAAPYGFYLRASPKPWGPWSAGKLAFDGSVAHDWYESGWRGVYGGYLLSELTADSGRKAYFTISLWVPYNIFLMEVAVDRLFQKKTVIPR